MSDIEKAIESIQRQKAHIGIDYSNNKDMTVICLSEQQAEEAIKALDKQIPKKIVNDKAFGRCPECGYEFNSELLNEYNISHCPHCGQALDWSVKNE